MVIRRKNLTVGRKRSNYSLLFKMECVTVTQICFEQGNVVNDVMLPLLHPSFSSGSFPPAAPRQLESTSNFYLSNSYAVPSFVWGKKDLMAQNLTLC